MATILVTGAGGFLGRYIARALIARGDAVRSLSRGAYPFLDELGVDTRRGDLSDADAVADAVAGCDAVIHTAALASIWGPVDAFERTNVLGTHNVIDACRRHGVPRLVYTSTPSVVHAGGDVEGVDESAPYPTHFHAHYPRTKALAEQAVLAAHGDGLSTVALRPHLIWGPEDTNLLPRLIERRRSGKLAFVGEPKLVDGCYVDNAVDAHLLALDQLGPDAACGGRAYFVANDEPITAPELMNRMLDAVGLPAVDRTVPAGVARFAGATFELVWRMLGRTDEPRMTRFLAEQLSTAHWYDLSAARRDLGWAPRVSTDEGMARLKSWYAANPGWYDA